MHVTFVTLLNYGYIKRQFLLVGRCSWGCSAGWQVSGGTVCPRGGAMCVHPRHQFDIDQKRQHTRSVRAGVAPPRHTMVPSADTRTTTTWPLTDRQPTKTYYYYYYCCIYYTMVPAADTTRAHKSF